MITPCTDFLNVAMPTKRAAARLVREVFTGKLQCHSNQKELKVRPTTSQYYYLPFLKLDSQNAKEASTSPATLSKTAIKLQENVSIHIPFIVAEMDLAQYC